jgi:hypothetical protein
LSETILFMLKTIRLNSVGGLTLVAELKARWVRNDLIAEKKEPDVLRSLGQSLGAP